MANDRTPYASIEAEAALDFLLDVDTDDTESAGSLGGDYEWFGTGLAGDYEWFAGEEGGDTEAFIAAEEAESFGAATSGEDDDLAELESEVEADAYGYDVPAGVDMASLTSAVDMGTVLPASIQGGKFENLIEWVRSIAQAGDAEEIAARIAIDPRFKSWATSSPAVKKQIVADAVQGAVVPGVDMEGLAQIRAAWKNSDTSLGGAAAAVKATPGAIYEFATDDVPTTIRGWMSEIPFWGAMSYSDDTVVNQLAFGYWMLSAAGYDVYGWIAKKIDEQAPQVAEGDLSSLPDFKEGGVSVETLPVIDIRPPSSVSGLPEPQTILAFGYAAVSLAAIAGFR